MVGLSQTTASLAECFAGERKQLSILNFYNPTCKVAPDLTMQLNAYRIMWLLSLLRLPTESQAERKAHTKFRTDLIKDGFSMMQYSVYIRHCASSESGDVM